VIDDYYAYDENLLTFIGNRCKKYPLGDQIKVKLLEVDLQTKKMDFMIIDKKPDQKKTTYKKDFKGRKKR
jgi:ribonuclease R